MHDTPLAQSSGMATRRDRRTGKLRLVSEEFLRKIIHNAYAVWQKRLEQGTFEFPKVIGEAAGVAITATELSLILGGVALSAKRRPRYVKSEQSSVTSAVS
jgi:transposase